MANPIPSTTQRLVDPATGIITVPWLQWLNALVADQGNTIAWSSVTGGIGYTNGWSDLGGGIVVQYGTDGSGNVYMRGAMTGGAMGAVAFTLPSKFAPTVNRRFAVVSNGTAGVITVASSGIVTPNVGGNPSVFFDGVFYSVN